MRTYYGFSAGSNLWTPLCKRTISHVSCHRLETENMAAKKKFAQLSSEPQLSKNLAAEHRQANTCKQLPALTARIEHPDAWLTARPSIAKFNVYRKHMGLY